MGLYPQPNKWQCGPFALKHALIMLGRIVNEDNLSRIAGANWWTGSDEIKLGRAAKAYDCELRMIRRKDALRAHHALLLALRRGYPALLCVDNWNHWITVVGAERDKIIYIDSRKAPVVNISNWKQLKDRWIYVDSEQQNPMKVEVMFDLHPVIPKFRVRSKARFSLVRARYLRRASNNGFASHWDEYFDDLSTICSPRTPRSPNGFPLGEFLRRHGAMIQEQISYWHGKVTPQQVKKILRNYQFVADTYDLVVRKEHEKKAIVAIATNLTLWAASKFGVDPVFGEY